MTFDVPDVDEEPAVNMDEEVISENAEQTNENDGFQPAVHNTDVEMEPPSADQVTTPDHSIKSWSMDDMEKAIADVEDHHMTIRGSAIKWGILPSSLRSWLNGVTSTKKRGPPTILTDEEEAEIVQWCKDMANIGHGLQVSQLKSTVAHLVGVRPNPFTNGIPGRSWWVGFRQRHPDLTIRTPEGVDTDRAIMLWPEIVSSFYDNLEELYNKLNYGPNNIWNCDETGVQAGINCAMRVIAKIGTKCVPQLIAKSREWITVLACVSVTGQAIPGYYLFKSKRNIKNYIVNCEPRACMAIQEHAWMTKELFMAWLKHFAKNVPGGVSPTNRKLLIFDGHGSHVEFKTVEVAKAMGIDFLTLPAHCSHKLQPLDVSVFSPFKNYFK